MRQASTLSAVPSLKINTPVPVPYGNVAAETHHGEPPKGDFEAVARRRCQDPKPEKEGRWWVLRYWQDEFQEGRRIRKRKRARLAKATVPEREARKIALEFMRPINQGLVPLGSAMEFAEFVDGTYVPVVLPQMAQSTQDRTMSVIKNYLRPQFGGLCLRDITVLSVDRYLAGLGKTDLSHESIDKVRDVLSAILVSAVRYGLLVKNPAEGVRLPHRKTGRRSKPYVTQAQFSTLLELVAEPYATMMFVAAYTGLRVSELIGLRWDDIHEHSITVDERCCRGDWGAPKTESSNATIAVNRAVIERIHRLKTLTVDVKAGTATRHYKVVKSCRPDDLVFQSLTSRKGEGHMTDNNILVRHIKPAARKLGLDFVNWRCLRTSYATWLKIAGADVKDAQALMRHSLASTTLDIYQQFVPESQRRVVDGLVN
jgi:integrase